MFLAHVQSAPHVHAHIDAHIHSGESFLAGLAHPILGLDHLLVLLAVGLWAAQLSVRGRWLVPVSFAGAMLLGALGGLALGGSGIEPLIAASVVAAGLLVTFGRTSRHGLAAAGAGLLAIGHGHAHGAEMPLSAGIEAAQFLGGMILTSGALMAVGIGLGALATLHREAVGRRALRAGGLAVACAGLMLITGLAG